LTFAFKELFYGIDVGIFLRFIFQLSTITIHSKPMKNKKVYIFGSVFIIKQT